MPLISQEEIIKEFAELADDFFCDLLLIKGQPLNTEIVHSGSIPFLHAHTLELSIKTLALKSNIELKYANRKAMGHDIKSMYEKVSLTYPNILLLLPNENQYRDARKLYFDSNDTSTILNIPNPEDIHILELAFYIENVMNLKYGFNKEFVRLTGFMVYTNQVNSKFLSLFKFCRDTYKNEHLNERIRRKIIGVAGNNMEVNNFINYIIL